MLSNKHLLSFCCSMLQRPLLHLELFSVSPLERLRERCRISLHGSIGLSPEYFKGVGLLHQSTLRQMKMASSFTHADRSQAPRISETQQSLLRSTSSMAVCPPSLGAPWATAALREASADLLSIFTNYACCGCCFAAAGSSAAAPGSSVHVQCRQPPRTEQL